MKIIANLYATHGLMVVFSVVAVALSIPEGRGRVLAAWRVPAAAVLAASSALILVAYPTWGELKNPSLWAFGIAATVVGIGRGYWMQLDVDHGWHLIRLTKAIDGLLATSLLCALVLVEIAVAMYAPADQPTVELGMSVLGAYLVGRAAAVMWRARHEPQADLHDRPSPPVQE